MKPIWIVDDDQSIRFVLEKALLREGLPTRSFTNPREVLKALDAEGPQGGPQVLVSDIRMPGGSGLDLLASIKQRLPNLPVIIMTAFSDLDSAVSAFSSGAFEYLPKPFDLPKAIELIRRAVEDGTIPSVDPDQKTEEVHDFITGLMIMARIHNSLDALERDLKPGLKRILGIETKPQIIQSHN